MPQPVLECKSTTLAFTYRATICWAVVSSGSARLNFQNIQCEAAVPKPRPCDSKVLSSACPPFILRHMNLLWIVLFGQSAIVTAEMTVVMQACTLP